MSDHAQINFECYQDDHLSGKPRKPGNVRKFDSCQGNVRDFTKNREMSGGKILVREKLPKTVYCKLHICVQTGIYCMSMVSVTLNMPSAAEECREPWRILHCLKSGHPVLLFSASDILVMCI